MEENTNCVVEKSENKDVYKASRFFYILEAAFEYFISLLVTGAFLAKVTTAIGISDTLTGILTSFVSLGCGFQIIAIFLANRRPVKRWVTILHITNQSFFALIYLVPFIKISPEVKIALFIAFLLLGHVINNVVNSPKINWFMTLVDNHKRGAFTATKEIVSLIGGMTFSFVMGTVIDHFEATGNVSGAFITCGISIFSLMLLHTLTLVLSKEKTVEKTEKVSTKKQLKELLHNKNLFKVILIVVLWNVVNHASTPFYGTYQIKELGFSMTFVSILTAGYSIIRAIFSRPLGKFADKYSFAKMLNVCFIIMLVGFVINVFTVPSNGMVFYTIYYILNAIAMAGISSATINLIYDYVPIENRTGAYALSNTLSGFAGFFATLIVSPLVSFIQNNGNSIFGISVYAQQVVSLIAAVLLVGLIIYLNTVVAKIKKNDEE
ncbi:MAG: MFS transporter [Clostridia bacterium]|nr:MFS transporter [Clostridia bacterium]